MGISLPGAGGGRTKNFAADLNLVPFIDLLSVCITFLMVTAVWTQISTMPLDQNISDPNTPPPEVDVPPPPPLTVHIRADGVWMGRVITDTDYQGKMLKAGKNYPILGEEYDWTAIETDLQGDRDEFPDEKTLVIVTDDGIFYEHMIRALDLGRANGYEQNLLGGGPGQASTVGPAGMAPPG